MRLLPRKSTVSALLALLLEAFLMNSVALSQASHRDADALSQASLIYIATVRKDGNQSKAAPVWFTKTSNGLVLIQTATPTWKAKRIRRASSVIVWIGKRSGPAFIGKAEITTDPAVISQIVNAWQLCWCHCNQRVRASRKAEASVGSARDKLNSAQNAFASRKDLDGSPVAPVKPGAGAALAGSVSGVSTIA